MASSSTGGGSVGGSGTTLPSYGIGNSSVSANGGSASVNAPAAPNQDVGGVTVALDYTPVLPPARGMVDIDSAFLDASTILNFATDRADSAENYIGVLTSLAANLNPPSINPNFPVVNDLPAIAAPVAPGLEPISYAAPEPPAAFAERLTVSAAFPLFSAGPPQLAFPNAPAQPVIDLPGMPGIDLNFAYPTVKVDLPPAPPLLSIGVEAFGGVTFPTLSATAPVLTAVEPTLAGYAPTAPYTDALLQSLVSGLRVRLEGGLTGTNTGLPALVEQGIWNRGREREYRQQADALTSLDRMEAMGYAFAPGTFVDAQIKLRTETHYTLASQSRDIAVEQAKLEQQNLKDALEQSTAIEGRLIEYANQTEQRRFDALKYMTEAGISIYNAKVQAYGAVVTAYRAAIDVYQAQITGARAQVEIYQARIAAEKLKVDANAVEVQSYKVRVDAALASIDVFKGEISIIQTQAQVEQLKVSVFGEEVRAYAAQAQLFATQVEAYKSGIQAEEAKEQVYATQATAYGTLVQATAKEIDSQIEVYKALIQAKSLEVDTYKAQVQSEAERVRAIAAQDQATASIYSATIQGTSSYNQTLVEEYKTQQTIAEQVCQIGVSAADAQGKLYLSAASIATDAAKVGAQVEAQLGASALGANTYATHRSRQDSLGYSQGTNFSQSKQVSQSSQTSRGANTNVSYSQSTSVSASTSGTAGFSNNTNIAEAQ